MNVKKYQNVNVNQASMERIKIIVEEMDKIYISFSGGKDSSVMMHMVMQEVVKQNKKAGVLIIDLEAQYKDTIKHIEIMADLYKDHIELHWVCVPLLLRNAVSNYEPRWCCWDEDKKDVWVREMPAQAKTEKDYPFFVPKMEFEEFMVLFGEWYGDGKLTAAFIGIRADESLHRYRAIVSEKKNLTFFIFRLYIIN
jgi:predicted phosphoadenosine phosphosulfate sulfurtransferase